MHLNEAEERRRRELLEQTKHLMYQEHELPAIHPRYKVSYEDLYGGSEPMEKGTFGIRAFICMICFAVFVFMQKESKSIFHVNSATVIQEVTKNTDFADIWKSFTFVK